MVPIFLTLGSSKTQFPMPRMTLPSFPPAGLLRVLRAAVQSKGSVHLAPRSLRRPGRRAQWGSISAWTAFTPHCSFKCRIPLLVFAHFKDKTDPRLSSFCQALKQCLVHCSCSRFSLVNTTLRLEQSYGIRDSTAHFPYCIFFNICNSPLRQVR